MSDLISRQDAIEQIQAWAVDLNHPNHLIRDDAVYILEALPSADRPKGEWLVSNTGVTGWWICSECGGAGDIQDRFCKHCGADMRGADDGR